MPNWNEVLREIEREQEKTERDQKRRQPSPLDRIRRRYLKQLHRYTKRNAIAYYSGWLVRTDGPPAVAVSDADKNAFMSAIHGLDRSQGLDLILHTPGGDLAATESLVDYLRKMFGTDMRAIVPQLAMSAGTMIACSCRSIVMGKQSNLGPTDPQIRGVPASGVLSEFNKAIEHIKREPAAAAVWQPIIGKYNPTFLESCQNAVNWADQMVREWLSTGMFEGDPETITKAETIAKQLADADTTLSHARHIHLEQLEEMGLRIERLEEDPKLQDLVLTVHHAFMHTFSSTGVAKIVENHNGVATILLAPVKKQ
ncbi:MAG: S49 family peptidase [Nitrococcus mobilis]|nr:S49 family peptidase [Nitrococcus mobilis]